MPAKPPKMPKNPTQEQLDDYSKTLEQYFKDKERELAEQQLESDRTLTELNKEKTNVELRERETLELQERNGALQAELEKDMAELDLKKQSHEDVWREEAGKLDKRRVELVEERRRLEKLAIELEHSKGVGGGTGGEDMLKFMLQQQDLLTKITLLEEKREIRETEESERLKLKDSIGRGVKPPIFRGDKGERPEAHILRAEDWMEASNPGMTNAMKVRNFKLTLDHLAREWYDNADSKGDYEKLKGHFSRHFSTQGKSVRNLHARWNSFTFDPNTDDIEAFLRNVQETAKQLEYREATVVNMIKSKMPLAMYSTLYDIHDLDKVVTRCRDIYAKSIDATAESSTATGGAAAANPFTAIKDEFFFMDDGAVNAQKQKPFKPHVTPQGRGKAEVEAEVVKAEEDSREAITQGRTILIEDNPIEMAGNLEVEVQEVVMTGAQTRESLEWLAEPLTRTGVTTAMSLDISPENAPRGIMAITTIGLNSTKLFQDLMWYNHGCMLRCQFLKWFKFQFRWQSHQPKCRCRTTA